LIGVGKKYFSPPRWIHLYRPAEPALNPVRGKGFTSSDGRRGQAPDPPGSTPSIYNAQSVTFGEERHQREKQLFQSRIESEQS